MMYKENFVAVVKCNGRVLRETNGYVRLPFGSQYSILLKNLDSRKAVVGVSVDGDEICDGSRIIVQPNSSVELKGKMRGGKVRHQFKFIERTKEISNHRGNRPDDGLIRIEYWFEQKHTEPVWYTMPTQTLPWVWSTWTTKHVPGDCDSGGLIGGSGGNTSRGIADGSSNIMFCNSLGDTGKGSTTNMKSSKRAPKTDVGITVQGSRTRQDFVNGYTDTLESHSTVIVIQLKGKTKQGRKLSKEVTTRTKFRCPTCGRKSKSYAKWCHNCGTNLE